MEDILTKLRALGVHIPEGLGDKELLRLAKLLNPWTVSTGFELDEEVTATVEPWCYATTTSRDRDNWVWGYSEAEAAMNLLLTQLTDNRYPVTSTAYKQSSMAYRANQ